ncbi:DUF7344 domain-containing protein [Palaeococcus ferrophilus]
MKSTTILGNERRMLLIEYLQSKEGKAELRDAVEFIAEKEGNTDRKHRKSIYVSLIQTHIPKMEREGIISYHSGVVTLVKVPENVTVYMEMVKKNDISWSSFYIGMSLIFAVAALVIDNMPLLGASVVYLIVGIVNRRRNYKVVVGE